MYQVNPSASPGSSPGSTMIIAPAMSGSPARLATSSERRLAGCAPTPVALAARVRPLTCTDSSVASRLRTVWRARPSASARAFCTISARAPQVEGQRGEQQQPGVDHAGPQHHPRAQAVAPAHAAGGHHVRVRRDPVGTASLRDGHAVARGGVAPILPTSAAMVPCTTRAVPGTVPDTVSIATETASSASTYAPTYAPVARRAQGALR